VTPRPQLAPVLPPDEAQKIFENDIWPAIGANGPRVAKPTLVVVGGQPGSGKSTTIRRMVGELGNQSTQKVIVDDLLCFMPNYYEASRRDARRAQMEVGSDPALWANELMARAFDRGMNILVEAASRRSVSLAREARERGYRTELHVIATSQQQSFVAMLDRFDRALATGLVAGSAILNKRGHDGLYRKWPRNLYEAEESKVFDRIVVARRDGHVLYENELVDKERDLMWEYSPRAVEALLEERHRSPTAAEARELRETWNRIANSDRLAADPFTKTFPLSEYKHAAIADIEKRCRSFALSPLEAGNHRDAAHAWYRFLARDLRAYLPSDDRRDGFTEQIHAYRRRSAQKAQRVIDTGLALGAAGGPDASPSRLHKQPEATRPTATTFARAVKRLKKAAAIKASDTYSSFDLSPADAERLEREALIQAGKRAGQNESIGGGFGDAVRQAASSMSSAYGSFDLSPADAERLEREALIQAGKRAGQNENIGGGVGVTKGLDVSATSQLRGLANRVRGSISR